MSTRKVRQRDESDIRDGEGTTGTADKDYNLLCFTETCLDNALRLGTYIQDAQRGGDTEVAELFQRAQTHSREGGEQGKKLLGDRLSR